MKVKLVLNLFRHSIFFSGDFPQTLELASSDFSVNDCHRLNRPLVPKNRNVPVVVCIGNVIFMVSNRWISQKKSDRGPPAVLFTHNFLMVNFYSLVGILKALSGNI
jgi:hypothetical protein